jgi:nucleotide-binding universal stress UspA family protein
VTTTTFETARRAREPRLAPVPRVLVALPTTEAPHGAVEAGRVIARALGAPLHGVLVWPTPITPCQVARLLRVEPQVLEGMVLHVDVGDPAERLQALTRAEPVAFLVLGAESHGRDLCGLGETAARIITATEAGAVVVRPGTSLRKLRRILVPLDGRPSTAEALCPVADLAERTAAALDLVMIEDAAARPPSEHGAMAPPRYVDQPQHEWPAFSEELVLRFLGAFARCPSWVPTRVFLGSGRPAGEILRFARALDADLIALVWHGDRVGEHGGTFREVLAETERPVLVLRREVTPR